MIRLRLSINIQLFYNFLTFHNYATHISKALQNIASNVAQVYQQAKPFIHSKMLPAIAKCNNNPPGRFDNQTRRVFRSANKPIHTY